MKSLASLVVVLGLIGCTKTVRIIDPSAPTTAPVTSFTVQFAQFFKPGTFHAELDGVDVTSSFVPVAAPSKTAKLVLPDTPDGFTGGELVGSGPPAQNFPVGTLPPDIHFTPGVAPPSTGGVGPPPPGGAPAGGPPQPKINFFIHTLHVSGQCYGMICDTVDDLKFVPPHLFGIPTTLDVKVGETVKVAASVYPPLKVPLMGVTLKPLSPSVKLNGGPVGASTQVNIPAGGSAPFSITGAVSANLAVVIEARGVQAGSIQGVVTK